MSKRFQAPTMPYLFSEPSAQAKPAVPQRVNPLKAVSHQPRSKTSAAGAADGAQRSACQMTALIQLMHDVGAVYLKSDGTPDGGLTDREAAAKLSTRLGVEIDKTSINSRRGSETGKQYIVDSGYTRPGPTGVPNTVYVHIHHFRPKESA